MPVSNSVIQAAARMSSDDRVSTIVKAISTLKANDEGYLPPFYCSPEESLRAIPELIKEGWVQTQSSTTAYLESADGTLMLQVIAVQQDDPHRSWVSIQISPIMSTNPLLS